MASTISLKLQSNEDFVAVLNALNNPFTKVSTDFECDLVHQENEILEDVTDADNLSILNKQIIVTKNNHEKHKNDLTEEQHPNEEKEEEEVLEDTFNVEVYHVTKPDVHPSLWCTPPSKTKKHICETCKKSFTYPSNLKRHIRTIHEEAKTFDCTVCGEKFTSKPLLTTHLNRHTEKKPHSCQHCGIAMRLASDLLKHERTHSQKKPFKCTFCDKAFTRANYLQQHMPLHTGEKPFECGYCDKRFKRNSHLIQHEQTHTGVKPFKCPVCDKGFGNTSNLRRHVQMHPFKS